jgi:hypothetical protein
MEPFTNVVGSVDDNVGFVVFFVGAVAGNARVAPMGDYHRRQVPEQQHVLERSRRTSVTEIWSQLRAAATAALQQRRQSVNIIKLFSS